MDGVFSYVPRSFNQVNDWLFGSSPAAVFSNLYSHQNIMITNNVSPQLKE